MSGISLRRRALFVVTVLALPLVLAFGAGLRINPTPSLPKGGYRIVSGAPERNDLVSFCLEGEFAELAKKRGYLEAGSCPSGLRPLLKRLAGLPGDFVDSSTFPIRSVDSQGRSVPSALTPGVIPPGMALVLTDHEGSFDSRYFGFIPLENLQRVEPVFIFGNAEFFVWQGASPFLKGWLDSSVLPHCKKGEQRSPNGINQCFLNRNPKGKGE